MKGACHCGAVSIQMMQQPDYMNDCNCTLCSGAGAVWGYIDPKHVTLSGETQSYERGDYEEPAVRVHFCGTCGNTTHWSPAPDIPQDRMGINMRLFPGEAAEGLTLNYPDGRSWDGSAPPATRRPAMICKGEWQ